CAFNLMLQASSFPNYGVAVTGGGLTCTGGTWQGSTSAGAFNSATVYVTCENKDAVHGDTDCKNCPGIPYGKPSDPSLFVNVFNFTGTENYGFPCTTPHCPEGSMIYFGNTVTPFIEKYAMCQSTKTWNIEIGVAWTNFTEGAYCAYSECSMSMHLAECEHDWRNCDDNVDYKPNEFIKCKDPNAQLVL
ncbi:hypothetical protein PENTCL1PPCAC_29243, partial [Pristionchus entomophagus]